MAASAARVVVARFREDVASWVGALLARGWDVVVYDKSGDDPDALRQGLRAAAEAAAGALSGGGGGGEGPTAPTVPTAGAHVVPCANVGREAETWLRHIVEYGEAGAGAGLAGLTLFLQGSPYEHMGLRVGDVNALRRVLEEAVDDWAAGRGPWAAGGSVEGAGRFAPLGKVARERAGMYNLPVAAYRALLDAELAEDAAAQSNDAAAPAPAAPQPNPQAATATRQPPPPPITFVPGGQYAVAREALHAKSHAFWRRWHARTAACTLMTWQECDGAFAEGAIDPWTMERLWMRLWA